MDQPDLLQGQGELQHGAEKFPGLLPGEGQLLIGQKIGLPSHLEVMEL
jgi:hypothetical protein